MSHSHNVPVGHVYISFPVPQQTRAIPPARPSLTLVSCLCHRQIIHIPLPAGGEDQVTDLTSVLGQLGGRTASLLVVSDPADRGLSLLRRELGRAGQSALRDRVQQLVVRLNFHR